LPRCHKVNIKLVLGDIFGQEIPKLHDLYVYSILYGIL